MVPAFIADTTFHFSSDAEWRVSEVMKIGDIGIDKIIRSSRKSLSIAVTNDGEVVVRTPRFLSEETIYGMVKSKSAWIKRKKAEAESRKVPPHKFLQGEQFLFLGRSYPLLLVDRVGISVDLADNLVISCVKKDIKALLIHWYRSRAEEEIGKRCLFYSEIIRLKPGAVKISGAMKRWGSCSSRGSLNFAWRLVMAPVEVIDYVVVHELVHLEEMNHSWRFWKKVASVMPDYERRRRWLSENGNRLGF